jgi:fructosamine-3-kinase
MPYGDLELAVRAALKTAGDPGEIATWHPVGGGDINEAARIGTQQRQYFVKWNAAPPPGFFEAEAHGLRLIREAGEVKVPIVIAQGRVPQSRTEFLVLDWIPTAAKGGDSAERLGRLLARQHLQRQPYYGLITDNYIGRLPQPNHPSESWIAFYRTQRLGGQRDLAALNGYLPSHRSRLLDRLMNSLDRRIDEAACQPSLLHGDLWGGNWMADLNGDPVVIDPAVYYGDREADLAMTALFGGFPHRFYDAYAEVFPLLPGFQERQLLYQLYYLLCHLNLFGEGYGSSVDTILRRLAG